MDKLGSLTGDGCFVFETPVLYGYSSNPIALAESADVDDNESPGNGDLVRNGGEWWDVVNVHSAAEPY